VARALLTIEVDASAVTRTFTDVREESRALSSFIRGQFERLGEVIAEPFRRARREVAGAMAAVRREEERATRAAEEGAHRRERIFAGETHYRESAAQQGTKAHERAEQERTDSTVRHSRRRVAEAQREAQELAAASRRVREATRQGEQDGGRAAAAAGEVAGGVHAAISGARGGHAALQRTVGSAVYQAGGTLADVRTSTLAIQQFAAANNMSSDELGAALNAAQTEFSVLGDRTTGREERGRRLQEFLRNSRLARDTGNSPAEMARLGGLLGQSGMDAGTQRALMLEAAGLAQRGSIELGSVTREAMPAITARIGQATSALGANATPEQRQQAARNAFVQAMAEIEVARGTQGTSAREAGNVLRNANVALTSDVTQQKILQNIRTRMGRNSDLERALYEADPNHRGQMRLRGQFTDALAFTEEFGRVAGNDSELFQNIFAGGGHGNPMGLIANQRRILGNLLNVDAGGKSGVSSVRELQQGSALTEADVRRGAEIFGGDEQALQTGAEERGKIQATDSANPFVRMTRELDRAAAENPLLAPLATLAGSKAAGWIGGKVGGMAGRLGAGSAGGGIARVLGPIGAFLGTMLTPGNEGQGTYSDRAMLRAHSAAGGGQAGVAAATQAMQTQLEEAVRRGVERGMQNTQVTVSPHDAVHAATTGSTRAAPSSP